MSSKNQSRRAERAANTNVKLPEVPYETLWILHDFTNSGWAS